MASWGDIADELKPRPEDRSEAAALLDACQAGLPLARTQSSLLRLSDAAVACLYASLEDIRPARSAAADAKNPSWMAASDFCYLNVRATQHDGRPGTFLQAAKILPGMAADAIHLAPFHPVHFELVRAPESQALIDPELADSALTAAGLGPAAQLKALVSACKLLGKAVGFELLPYLAQFGRDVLERPELFHWIHLDDERAGLLCDDQLKPYGKPERLANADAVRRLSLSALSDYGVATLLPQPKDRDAEKAAKDKAYYATIHRCIDNGLWPVLMNPWNGVGRPGFLRYDRPGDFPVFAYRDLDGSDVSAEASGVIVPYAFFDGLPPSHAGQTDQTYGLPDRNEQAIRYYTHMFERWRDDYGFDFVRYTGVDHSLDSCADDSGCVPLSDRPTPEILAEAMKASRQGVPGVGALAERAGRDPLDYASLGFDLLSGSESLRRIDAPLLRESFLLYDRLAGQTGETARRWSVCFSVDTHDAGAPHGWGTPLAAVLGRERMRLRHAVARFLSVGPVRRPLYETMGFQDLSTGLYEADVSARGLAWNDDAEFSAGYAAIERLYRRLRPFLDSAAIAERHVEPAWAWWTIKDRAQSRVVVVACSLETADGHAPGDIKVALDRQAGCFEGRTYHLPDDSGAPVIAEGSLTLSLGYLDCHVVDLSPSLF